MEDEGKRVRHVAHVHKWTQYDKAYLTRRFKAGATDKALAEHFGVTEQAVRIQRYSLHLQRRYNRTWTVAKLKEIATDYESGMPIAEIRKKWGIRYNQEVYYMMYKYQHIYNLPRYNRIENKRKRRCEGYESDD